MSTLEFWGIALASCKSVINVSSRLPGVGFFLHSGCQAPRPAGTSHYSLCQAEKTGGPHIPRFFRDADPFLLLVG